MLDAKVNYEYYNNKEASWRNRQLLDNNSTSKIFDYNTIHSNKLGLTKPDESEIERLRKIAIKDNSDKYVIKPKYKHVTTDPTKQLLKISVIPEDNNPPAKIIIEIDLTTKSKEMPKSSIFPSLDLAIAFLTELFTAYSIHPITKKLTKVKINRSQWNIEVIHEHAGIYELMSNSLPFPPSSTRLDSVFYVEDLYYYWHRLEQHPIPK